LSDNKKKYRCIGENASATVSLENTARERPSQKKQIS